MHINPNININIYYIPPVVRTSSSSIHCFSDRCTPWWRALQVRRQQAHSMDSMESIELIRQN